MRGFGAVVLAAGRGSRMQSKKVNKVTLSVGDGPMIVNIVKKLEEVGVHPIVVVVGFAKESVMKFLGDTIYFAEQKELLGTANALQVGLKKMPENIGNIMATYGDSSFPKEEIQNLIKLYEKSDLDVAFITIDMDDARGLGRIIRDRYGKLIKIVEEKDATDEEKKVTEINPGYFIFRRNFLERYLPRIKKSGVTGEYYLGDLIKLAIENGEKIDTLRAGKVLWRGVNTMEELKKANRIYAEQ